jgi:hypothetical protein
MKDLLRIERLETSWAVRRCILRTSASWCWHVLGCWKVARLLSMLSSASSLQDLPVLTSFLYKEIVIELRDLFLLSLHVTYSIAAVFPSLLNNKGISQERQSNYSIQAFTGTVHE